MSTWTAPITFVAATLTVAQMNTEVRDHLNFLKGALDLLTNSTTADTGDTMSLIVKRVAGTSAAFSTNRTADTQARLAITADGDSLWSGGSATADLFMRRRAAGELTIDHTSTGNQFIFASSATVGLTYLYTGQAYIYMNEIPDPASSGVNEARLFCRDNGAGKTQIAVIFNTGAVQVIATQP